MAKLTSAYSDFLNERNQRIYRLRRRGKTLKYLSVRFDLSIRQISRIINRMSNNVQ